MSCLLCPVYRPAAPARLPVWPPVCDGCRERCNRDLSWIPQGYAMLPQVLACAPNPAERVSGSPDPAAPLNLSALDLSLPAHQGSRGPFTRGVLGLDEDQVGDLPVATILDTWVRDWVSVRGLRERLPVPTVAALAGWMLAGGHNSRLSWALDHHHAVDEFAAELRELCGSMRGVLGLVPARPVPVLLVPCRACDLLTLIRVPGSDYIECGSCPTLLTEVEFRRWAGLVAEDAKRRTQEEAA